MKSLLIKRTIAYLLDLLIINVIIVLQFNKILEPYINIKEGFFSPPKDFTLIITLFMIMLLTLLYFTILEYKIKQTIGKMVMGLYVQSKKPTFNNFLIRNLTKPFFILLIIDTIYLLIKKTNKRYTEVLSQTEVKEI